MWQSKRNEMILSSSKSLWSFAALVTAVMYSIETEPTVQTQSAAYRVDKEKWGTLCENLN